MDWTFAASGPLHAALELEEGSISVVTGAADTATVSLEPMGRREDRAAGAIEQAEVTFDGNRLVVKLPKGIRRAGAIRMEVAVPEGSSLTARSASADIVVRGNYGAVEVSTASGDIDSSGAVDTAKVDTASGDATIALVRGWAEGRSASGELSFESIGGRLSLATASGDVEVGDVGGEASISTASGSVRIHSLGGAAVVRAVSGDVELCLVERGDVKVSTTSGDVSVYVAKGVGTWLDLNSHSGDTSCSLPAEDGARSIAELRLTCQTVSGDISVQATETPRRSTSVEPTYGNGTDAGQLAG